jgi:hypothetical protein
MSTFVEAANIAMRTFLLLPRNAYITVFGIPSHTSSKSTDTRTHNDFLLTPTTTTSNDSGGGRRYHAVIGESNAFDDLVIPQLESDVLASRVAAAEFEEKDPDHHHDGRVAATVRTTYPRLTASNIESMLHQQAVASSATSLLDEEHGTAADADADAGDLSVPVSSGAVLLHSASSRRTTSASAAHTRRFKEEEEEAHSSSVLNRRSHHRSSVGSIEDDCLFPEGAAGTAVTTLAVGGGGRGGGGGCVSPMTWRERMSLFNDFDDYAEEDEAEDQYGVDDEDRDAVVIERIGVDELSNIARMASNDARISSVCASVLPTNAPELSNVSQRKQLFSALQRFAVFAHKKLPFNFNVIKPLPQWMERYRRLIATSMLISFVVLIVATVIEKLLVGVLFAENPAMEQLITGRDDDTY